MNKEPNPPYTPPHQEVLSSAHRRIIKTDRWRIFPAVTSSGHLEDGCRLQPGSVSGGDGADRTGSEHLACRTGRPSGPAVFSRWMCRLSSAGPPFTLHLSDAPPFCCPLSDVHCPPSKVLRPLSTAHFRRPMSDVQCLMSSVQRPAPPRPLSVAPKNVKKMIRNASLSLTVTRPKRSS